MDLKRITIRRWSERKSSFWIKTRSNRNKLASKLMFSKSLILRFSRKLSPCRLEMNPGRGTHLKTITRYKGLRSKTKKWSSWATFKRWQISNEINLWAISKLFCKSNPSRNWAMLLLKQSDIKTLKLRISQVKIWQVIWTYWPLILSIISQAKEALLSLRNSARRGSMKVYTTPTSHNFNTVINCTSSKWIGIDTVKKLLLIWPWVSSSLISRTSFFRVLVILYRYHRKLKSLMCNHHSWKKKFWSAVISFSTSPKKIEFKLYSKT